MIESTLYGAGVTADRRERSDLLAAMERHWGYREFRPWQREAMNAVLEGRDSVVVLPTGGGKSLCYQVPADAMGRLAVVVSPLISLMKDQVDALLACGVPAAFLNSSLPAAAQREVVRGVREGSYRLLYVAPERLAGDGREGFREFLRGCGVAFVAVDEAHCISHWGHDFRPEYRRLGALREELPDASIHAFTATATPRVREDIAVQLRLVDATVIVGSFERPNLIYRAIRRASGRTQVRQVIVRHAGEGGIVYCISRREVEALSAHLQAAGVRALPYHAGLDDETRRRHQEAFIGERAEVIVATVAFGMGIDRSNVRYVVHAGAPRSVEQYQQESGRAGRDGLPAECVLLYSWADREAWRRILATNGQLDAAAETHLREMFRYASQVRCRHRALVEYFGQVYQRDGCGACDVCLDELEEVEDPVILGQKILSCVLRVGQRWGISHLVDVLRGRCTERIKGAGHQGLSTFGLLADCPTGELRAHVEQLVELGFLAQVGEEFPVLRVTEEGRRLLRGDAAVRLFRHRRPTPGKRERRRARADAASWEGIDRGLFEALRALRLELAGKRGVPPYVIFHDATLRDMARRRPSSSSAFRQVHGVGERKAEDLGPRFLALIATYCRERGIELDSDA